MGVSLARRATAVLLLVAAGLLAGCVKRDSVIVGALPDDYRTRHPIVLAEKEKTLDIPVPILSYRMTPQQSVAIDGFMDDYGDSGPTVVTILVPHGSANGPAASRVADDIAAFLRRGYVPEGYLQVLPYQASAGEVRPVRLTYGRLEATVAPCGRWPEDLLDTYENRNYENFGCSYQNNLAAQVANPMDFLGPRKKTTIDAENRVGAIEKYRGVKEPLYEAGKVSADFNSNREVEY